LKIGETKPNPNSSEEIRQEFGQKFAKSLFSVCQICLINFSGAVFFSHGWMVLQVKTRIDKLGDQVRLEGK
jgi:hypothetical protein